jgi:DNA polymerase III subunit gamma/tau
MTYYRKYRPQTVSEIDLVSVRQSFSRILTSGTFAHAYLFAGPKGTGKTSSARILAKVLNCEKNRKQKTEKSEQGILREPCNECASCKAIMNGSSLAVMEMDAASNRGIDDIRVLRERVALTPGTAAYAVYVIDEVHMLTNEAFNALLKTLEEPPAHAIFILCTTETHKIPDTILSRCTLVPFTKASVAEVVGSLKKAVAGEQIKIDMDALELLASRMDGSFRDGMKYLEQLAQAGNQITQKEVDEVLGFSGIYDMTGLVSMLIKRDVPGALAELAVKMTSGADMPLLGKRLVEAIREMLLKEVSQVKRNESSVAELIHLAEKANDAVVRMKQAVIPSLPLEMLIVEWGMSKTAITPQKPQEPQTVPIPVATIKQEPKPQPVKAPVTEKPVNEVRPEKIEVIEGKMISVEEIQTKWQAIMKGVRPHNHSLEALLRAARPLDCRGNTVTIEVFYTFHKEQLEQDRHLAILEKVFFEVMKTPVKMAFVLGSKVKRAAAASGVDVANVTGHIEDENVAEAVEEIFGK